jgi:hypothetical protein
MNFDRRCAKRFVIPDLIRDPFALRFGKNRIAAAMDAELNSA